MNRTALLLVLMAALPANAQVYRWVDAQGQVHFDDRSRHRGLLVTREWLAARPVAAASGEAAGVPREWQTLYEQKCAIARERVAVLRTARAVYGLTPFGDEFPLSEAERRLALLESEAEAADHCRPDAARKAWQAALAQAAGDPSR